MGETRVPVLLLTGFLGAGKSTLLNAMLAGSGAERCAVIVNEYGEVGLDHDLIAHSDEEIVLLESGCVCCTIRGDLVGAISGLLDQRAGGTLAFDRIVIETTGLADPVPIKRTLLGEAALKDRVRLDGIVTLADALHLPRTLDAQFEAVSQVILADVIVLTKTDLADPDQIANARARVRRLNAEVEIISGEEAASDPSMLWGRGVIRPGVSTPVALSWMGGNAGTPAVDPLANLSGFAPAPKQPQPDMSRHESQIESAAITIATPLDGARLQSWLNDLMAMRGEDILRVKGLVFLAGQEAPMLFHAVQHVFDGPVALDDWRGGERRSRVVMIARNMSQTRLRRTLERLRR